ncbi:hypothetical protein CFOL_v3_33863 [Cephalotus follicularis]|uniref:Uncharacterized protein n=1 Tax=Cephalotus follicularis TaxID=3775 RepID=A0A1Q3DDA6_CEPFO|nr:hypothetical protein CFOL_v3_33863 [Cephalotus follicularis]
MNEYHIINKLQEMTMVSNAHKIRNNLDKVVANILIAGFTDQIKGWWDNVLTKQQQTEILEVIQVNELKEPILNNDNETIEDAVSTLIYNIANYFVGDPTYLKDRTADQLSNLRCRKLQDFRWYKDTFMTKVLTREDANQPYWKEKFITGLPTLFAEKIKNKYREKHKGVVPYEKLTYGDIVSTITKTGLEICYDIKMSKQIKKDSKTYKKELGKITYKKWHINITITIQDSFKLQITVLIDSGTQMNCIQGRLIPTKYFEKTKQRLSTTNGENLRVKFKISDVYIYNEGICIKQSFILVKDLDIGIILSQPFLEIIKPFKVKTEGITIKIFNKKFYLLSMKNLLLKILTF